MSYNPSKRKSPPRATAGTSFRAELDFWRNQFSDKPLKYEDERLALVLKGFDNISSSKNRIKIWPLGVESDAVYVQRAELPEFAALPAAQIAAALAAIRNPETSSTETSATTEQENAMSKTRKTAAKKTATTTTKTTTAPRKDRQRAEGRLQSDVENPYMKQLLAAAAGGANLGSIGENFADLFKRISEATRAKPVKLSALSTSYMKKKARRLAEAGLVASEKVEGDVFFFKKNGGRGGDGAAKVSAPAATATARVRTKKTPARTKVVRKTNRKTARR